VTLRSAFTYLTYFIPKSHVTRLLFDKNFWCPMKKCLKYYGLSCLVRLIIFRKKNTYDWMQRFSIFECQTCENGCLIACNDPLPLLPLVCIYKISNDSVLARISCLWCDPFFTRREAK
jgi:hypothetical protein